LGDDDPVNELSAAAFGLFGREDALQVMSDVLVRGGSAVATGDPGAGKSSLLRVLDQLAQRRGRRVLSVTPTQFERGLPFAGLAELVAQCPEGADRGLPVPQQRALSVALRRVEPDGQEVDALAVPLAVRGLLTHLCQEQPVAIIIDDLQWLDLASVGSLAFALRRISVEPQRLCVLVGSRPEGAGGDLVRALAEPRREFTLGPLEDWAIGQLLRKRLGSRWTRPMSVGVARASGGNPFLALMIAQAMQSDVSMWRWSAQGAHAPVFPVPPSLAGLLGEKVMLLPQDARDVLLLVSVAGRLTVAQLQGIVDATVLRSALEAAADADVAVVGAEAVVTFTHPMLASAIYDAATPGERRRAHHVLAEKLDDPVERARHRSRTITAPDGPVARDLEQAADISRARGAQQLAGELLERAAMATPADADAGLGRWLRAVDTYLAAGDGAAAETALDSASPLAVDSEQQAQVLMRRVRLSDQHSGVRSLAEQALLLAPKGTEIRAEVLTDLGSIRRSQGHGDDALRLMRQAVIEAAEVKRFDVQLTALNERLAIEQHWGLGQPQQTLRDIERLIDSSGSDLPAAPVAWTRGFFATWHDETAEEHVRAGIRSAVDAGRYGDLAQLYICLVLVHIRASRVRDAQAALDEADRIGAWAASSRQEDMARVLVKEYTGDLGAARELALGAVARSREHESTYWLAGFLAQLGFVEISARNWQAALEVLREVAGVFASTEMVDLEQLLWGVDYADAALQLGSLPDVEAAIAVLRRQGESGRPEATAAADRCQALLTAAGGNVDDALSALVKVVAESGSECPFEAARSRLALGQVYRRAGYKRMASDALNAAADVFEELGIPRWAERARDEAGRVGLHPAATTLTATEHRVAQLVGSGHSNQETAAELFMSVKTVEANLTRIYRKLSVRSRTELANRMNTLDSGTEHDR
jgi:DNA-binding CsgD family transcriptional regulator/energy-coupling factor transporter ATP-binding protein EcfA2